MSESVIHARGGAGETVQGKLLFSRDAFSPRYDLDRSTGIISRAGHDLAGHSIVDTIPVFPAAKGGVAAGWAIYALRAAGIAPRAFVFVTVNPVFVQGCVHAGVPILHGLDPEALRELQSGLLVEVDPTAASLSILSPAAGGDVASP